MSDSSVSTSRFRRFAVPGVLLLILTGGMVYLILGDTAPRQTWRLSLARKHIPAVEKAIAGFEGPSTKVSADVYTGEGGVIMVRGTVATTEELAELKKAVEGTQPPVGVIYQVRVEAAQIDLQPIPIRLPSQGKRLDIEEARELVRSHVYSVRPQYNRDALIEVKDVTPDDAWTRFGMQMIHFEHWNVVFIVNGRDLISLGSIWPGSVMVTDLNRDGNSELVYMRTEGSGNIVSYVDVAERSDDNLTIHRGILACMHDNFCIPEKITDYEVGIFDTDWRGQGKGWTPSNRLGTLWFNKDRGEFRVVLCRNLGMEVTCMIRAIEVNGGETKTFTLQAK